MSKVLIVGGGAAGMLAGIIAGRNGHEVCIFDGNEKLGKKLFITGKGRCNLTNACEMKEFFDNIVTNPKFMFSSFKNFDNFAVISFFEELGLATKIERGNRVFPESDKSSDVINALRRELTRLGTQIRLGEKIKKISTDGQKVTGVVTEKNERISGDAVIVATGGLSYPVTGSTGDGYEFAKNLGHTVTECSRALTSLRTKESFVKELEGLSLKNISISITCGNKEIYSDFGEMLFTGKGVSGPVILSGSSYASKYLRTRGNEVLLHIDLKPALTKEQLDSRLLRDFEAAKNKAFRNALDSLLPTRLTEIIISLSGIDPLKKVNSITVAERTKLLSLLKDFILTITEPGGWEESVITQGGVNVKEINPTTMESKLVKGLYFAGEVIDIDALTGGFNLQLAWSSAYAAASHIE